MTRQSTLLVPASRETALNKGDAVESARDVDHEGTYARIAMLRPTKSNACLQTLALHRIVSVRYLGPRAQGCSCKYWPLSLYHTTQYSTQSVRALRNPLQPCDECTYRIRHEGVAELCGVVPRGPPDNGMKQKSRAPPRPGPLIVVPGVPLLLLPCLSASRHKTPGRKAQWPKSEALSAQLDQEMSHAYKVQGLTHASQSTSRSASGKPAMTAFVNPRRESLSHCLHTRFHLL
jgi:hypothetical protein